MKVFLFLLTLLNFLNCYSQEEIFKYILRSQKSIIRNVENNNEKVVFKQLFSSILISKNEIEKEVNIFFQKAPNDYESVNLLFYYKLQTGELEFRIWNHIESKEFYTEQYIVDSKNGIYKDSLKRSFSNEFYRSFQHIISDFETNLDIIKRKEYIVDDGAYFIGSKIVCKAAKRKIESVVFKEY